jgi:hypothetical protein
VKKITRILAIHYYYFPVNAIGTRRNTNVLNQLAELTGADEVMVVSTANPYIGKDLSLKVKYLPVQAKTLDLFAYSHFKGTYFKKRKVVAKAIPKENVPAGAPLYSRYVKFKNSLLGNLVLGEGGWLYILSAFLKARRFVDPHTLIVSSFSPFSDHIIAYLLKLFNPRALWVADFRDLYLQDGVRNVYAFGFHKYLLKKMLLKADLVTTVSEGLLDPIKRFAGNAVVLRNGIGLEKIRNRNGGQISEKFVISYTGSLYGSERDPSPILGAIRSGLLKHELDAGDLVINYAGFDGGVWDSLVEKFGLSNMNVNHGVVPKDKALALQNESSINIAITWCDKNNKGILTGKFFEYIEAGNLILVLIRGEKDIEFERIIEQTKVGAFFYEGQGELIERYITGKYRQWKQTKQLDANYDFGGLKQYTWDSQVRSAVIDNLNILSPVK